MSNFKNIMDYCRLCQENLGTVCLTQSSEFNQKVYECTNVNVEEQLYILPQSICADCFNSIELLFSFRQEVQRINENLYNILVKSVNSFEDVIDNTVLQCPEDNLNIEFLDIKEPMHENNDIRKSGSGIIKRKLREMKKEQNNSNGSIVDRSELFDNDSDSVDRVDDPLENNLSCPVCSRQFLWNVDLQVHLKTHETVYKCTYENCNKVCRSAYNLKTHQMDHEGKRPFLCVTCGKRFARKNSLICHEKIHQSVKGYSCDICNIGFSVHSNLRAHEKKHHEGVRFYCSQCPRAYITKCSLDRHELVHTGRKEFVCKQCLNAFYTRKELEKHQRYHEGTRQYKCDQCFKMFFEKHHLTVHLRIHSGVRPYVCKVEGCGKSFIESQKLTRHMKARHPQARKT